MKVLYMGIKNDRDARAKQVELEDKRGLKLSRYSAYGGYVFQPVLHKDIPTSTDAAETAVVLSHIPSSAIKATSFLGIAESSGVALVDVLSSCQTLVAQRKIIPVICRDGKKVGCYRV